MQRGLGASEVEPLYVYLGGAYAFQNAWQQAQQAYEELLAYAQHQRLPRLVSMTLNRLAILAVQQAHDKPQLRALLDEAWRIADTRHDHRGLVETHCHPAHITEPVWGDHKLALPHT